MKNYKFLVVLAFALAFTSCQDPADLFGDLFGNKDKSSEDKAEKARTGRNRRASNIDPKFRDFSGWGLIAFKGKLLRIGGIRDGKNFPVSEVWESADGFRWEERTPKSDAQKDAMVKNTTLFEPRRGMAVFELHNRLYVFGGWYDTGNILGKIFRAGFGNDLWASRDGTEWELIKNQDVLTEYVTGMQDSAVVTYADRNDRNELIDRNVLIIGGGQESSNALNHVWGIQVTSMNAVSELRRPKMTHARKSAAAIRFNDKVYVIGGVQDYAYGLYIKNMLRSDDNGTTWVNASPKSTDDISDLLHRADHQAVVFNDRIFVIGGYRGSFSGVDQHYRDDPLKPQKDVWSSADGENWEREGEIVALPDKWYYYRAVVFDGKIFVIGADRTWVSEDGTTWTDGPQTFVE